MDDRLRPCKHISLKLPSPIFIVGLSTRVGWQPNCDSTCFSGCDFFLRLDLIIAMIHTFTCQICILGSVVRALRFMSERLPVLIKTVCFLVAKARQHFLNLRNPNHLFPRAIIDCLREAKSFLQIECANESSFAKTIQSSICYGKLTGSPPSTFHNTADDTIILNQA